MTVLEVIQRSAGFLAQKGIEESRLHAELLLAHVLKLRRMQLYLNFDRQLSVGELDCYRALVKRRALREPLQHIVGSAWFCGLEIGVNRHVLIPRPETELLAEQGWQFLCGRARQDMALDNANAAATEPCALDFGTGSACVALALAAKCRSAIIYALDISREALETASKNAEKLGFKDRASLLLVLLDPLVPVHLVDLAALLGMVLGMVLVGMKAHYREQSLQIVYLCNDEFPL